MQTTAFAVVAILAAFAAADSAKSNSAFKTDVSNYVLDDSSYSYCNPGYPSAQSYAPLPGAKLELVQAVVRHGDRTPVNYIPNDDSTWNCNEIEEETYLHGTGESEKNTTGSFRQVIAIPKWNQKYGFSNKIWKGSCEEGELTDHGKRQHNILGTQLRAIYVDKLGYLPKELNSTDEVYLRTTYIWRTKNSAESLLGALWPKRGIAPKDAILLHTYPKRIETMYGNTDMCPQINTIMAQLVASDGYQKFLQDQGPLMAKLSDIMDVHGSSWKEGWDGYFDVLNARQCHGFKLPCKHIDGVQNSTQCASAADVAQVTHNANYEWAYKYRDSPQAQNLTRLYIGSFVGTLRDQMQDRIAGHTGSLKLALYSAHDSTVWPLLSVLDAGDRQSLWPPYASNLIFELWKQQNGSRVVRVIFNGEVLNLRNAWCDMNACPVEKFFKHIDAFIPSDIANECSN